jgi:uncharacterized protein YecT (DUF1311 family)
LHWRSSQSKSDFTQPVFAQDRPDPDRSITDNLPLFAKNHCERALDAAGQMFCGDPELNAAGVRLSRAIAERLDRIPNRSLAIEENAEWIRDRNSSCGIPAGQSIRAQDIEAVRNCLLKETNERIEILNDPEHAGICDRASRSLPPEAGKNSWWDIV